MIQFQARTLAPQLAENSEIRFFVATQTLKPQNQIHLVELNESTLALKKRVRMACTSSSPTHIESIFRLFYLDFLTFGWRNLEDQQ